MGQIFLKLKKNTISLKNVVIPKKLVPFKRILVPFGGRSKKKYRQDRYVMSIILVLK